MVLHSFIGHIRKKPGCYGALLILPNPTILAANILLIETQMSVIGIDLANITSSWR